MKRKRYEDFCMAAAGGDLFDRVDALEGYLTQNDEKMIDSLGLQAAGAVGPEVVLLDRDGISRPAIMLGSNSYLNLTTHREVVQAANEATEAYGYGAGAVSLYAGITELHRQLEEAIARFLGTEDAILFASGYGGNVGTIAALCRPGDVIINDSANHASIFDGSMLSGATLKIYPHRRMDRLEQVLHRLPASSGGRLIITDGVFSMHGDLAPLDQIVELAERYHARVMVDDAHGIGLLGPTGRGTAEHFGVLDAIDLHVTPLSKAPGGLGGFCAGSRALVQYLRLYARSYFFSTALPVSVVAGLLKVFELFEADAAGRRQLWQNIRFMKNGLDEAGFNTGKSASGLIPIIVGDEKMLAQFHRELLERGVYTNLVSYPAVRRKEARLRVCVMKNLGMPEMQMGLDRIIVAGKVCKVI